MRLLISGYGGETGETAGVYDFTERRFIWQSGVKSISYMCSGGGVFFGAGEHGDRGFVYMFTPDGGGYRLAGTARINGGALCHIAYSRKHKILAGACYGSGDIFSLEVKPDGFGEMKTYTRQGGTEAGVTRAHCAVFGNDEDELYSANIALDRVFRYKINNGQLHEIGWRQLDRGVGSRHFKCINGHPYVITEYSNEIIPLDDEPRRVSTLPDGFTGKSTCSTMCVLPVNGEYSFVYAANRGADTVAVFKQNISTGEMVKIHDCDCGGKCPRHIEIVGAGEKPMLAVANQNSGEAVLFEINPGGSLGEKVLTIPFGGASFIEEFYV